MSVLTTIFFIFLLYIILCIISPQKRKIISSAFVKTRPDSLAAFIANLENQAIWNPWIISEEHPKIYEGGEPGLPGSYCEWKSKDDKLLGRISNIKIEDHLIIQRLELAMNMVKVIVLEHQLHPHGDGRTTHWDWIYEEKLPFFKRPVFLIKDLVTTQNQKLKDGMRHAREALERQ
ncbi:hypothetical protein [Membranihabitans maritimus]|uniref:hypothetical protein n=1 Tax=Membranihabitans maritimus TaxID=2904244 RepID=UPI001F26813B|nr:hypothetical protein [Membranihabitans maritimus]